MAQMMERTYIDCRDFPSDTSCSLRISGTREEVLAVAAYHAVATHGHADSPDLRKQLGDALRPESPT